MQKETLEKYKKDANFLLVIKANQLKTKEEIFEAKLKDVELEL